MSPLITVPSPALLVEIYKDILELWSSMKIQLTLADPRSLSTLS